MAHVLGHGLLVIGEASLCIVAQHRFLYLVLLAGHLLVFSAVIGHARMRWNRRKETTNVAAEGW